MITTIVGDLRYAARKLRADRSFTGAAVLALALGIGASTAIYSALRPVLLDPLPYRNADRLVTVKDHVADGAPLDPTFGSYRELLARSRSFQSLAVMQPWNPTISERDVSGTPAERLDGQRVSESYFRTLETAPRVGRGFDSAEDRPRGRNEVVVSHGLWLRRFGGDSGIVGRQIVLDGVEFTVVAIMPPDFENVTRPSASVWTLLQYDPSFPPNGPEWYHNISIIGRLRASVSAVAAQRELATIAHNRVNAFVRPPWASMSGGLAVSPLRDDVTRTVKPVLFAVLAAVALLLLTTCFNVTNLMLARGTRRRSEMALRAALGASRRRLVGQLLAEAIALAVAGGALGILLGQAGVNALVAIAPADLPRVGDIRVDAGVLAFTLALSVTVGVVTGLVPALAAARANVHHALNEGTRRSSPRQGLARSALIVAELSLAVVLLVSTGLLMRSLSRVFAIDPGFEPANVLTMQIRVSGPRFDSDAATRAFFAQVLDAVRHAPGVRAAAVTSQVPLSGDDDLYGVHFQSSPAGHDAPEVVRYAVSAGFFETMHITPLRGRVLDASDRDGAPLVAVFNQSFAARVFPGRDPIGQHVHIGAEDGPWYTVAGIVPDIKQLALGAKQSDEVFVMADQSSFADRTMSIVARTDVPPASAAPAIQRAIWSVDRTQAVSRVAPMEQLLRASESQRHFALVVFEAFGIAALVLATIGIYGVLASGVVERTREIGIRVALGASPARVRALVIRQGMWLAVVGVAIGAVAAAAGSRALNSVLFGITRVDPLTYLVVLTVVGVAALLACWLPAARAAAVDPSITLQAE